MKRRIHKQLAFALLVVPLATLAGGDAAYKSFPVFEYARARPFLVVARVAPGGELPEFEECKRKDVICLHSPEWFRATSEMTVYGNDMPRRISIATASHYGQERYKKAGTWLINLVEKDGALVMPINQYETLVRRDDGELFLPLQFPDEPIFLPCSVKQIWEELAPRRFRQPLRRFARKDFDWSGVDEHPEMFVVEGDFAVPRYGLRMTRLKDLLRSERLQASDRRCGQEVPEHLK